MTKLTPGFWYLKIDHAPFYTIVEIIRCPIGPCAGELSVFSIGREESYELAAYAEDQFLGPVPPYEPAA